MSNPHKARLTRFMLKYDSKNLDKVDMLLTKFAGEEEELMIRLIDKYGPEPPAKTAPAASSASPTRIMLPNSPGPSPQPGLPRPATSLSAGAPREAPSPPPVPLDYRSRVIAMYETYMPSKLASLDVMLDRYKGSEDVLIEALVGKYGPEPSQAPAAAASSSQQGVPPSNFDGTPDQQRLHKRLSSFYSKYNPSEMHKVDLAMRAGFPEDRLFSNLCSKYNVSEGEFRAFEASLAAVDDSSHQQPIRIVSSREVVATSVEPEMSTAEGVGRGVVINTPPPAQDSASSGPQVVLVAQVTQQSSSAPPTDSPVAPAAPAASSPQEAAQASPNTDSNFIITGVTEAGAKLSNQSAVAAVPAPAAARAEPSQPPANVASTATLISPAATLPDVPPVESVPPKPTAVGDAVGGSSQSTLLSDQRAASGASTSATSKLDVAGSSVAASPIIYSTLPPVAAVVVSSMVEGPPVEHADLAPRLTDVQPVVITVGTSGPLPAASAASSPIRADPAAAAATTSTSAAAASDSLSSSPSVAAVGKRQRIEKFLAEHSPQDIGNVDILMTFNVTEADLFAQLRRRYGIADSSVSSTASASSSPSMRLKPIKTAPATYREELIDDMISHHSPPAGESIAGVQQTTFGGAVKPLPSIDNITVLEVALRERNVQLHEMQRDVLQREKELLEEKLRQQHVDTSAAHSLNDGETALDIKMRNQHLSQQTFRESVLIARENDAREFERAVLARELAVSNSESLLSKEKQQLAEKEQELREREHNLALRERAISEREAVVDRRSAEAVSIRNASHDSLEQYAADLETKLQVANAKVRELMTLCYPKSGKAAVNLSAEKGQSLDDHRPSSTYGLNHEIRGDDGSAYSSVRDPDLDWGLHWAGRSPHKRRDDQQQQEQSPSRRLLTSRDKALSDRALQLEAIQEGISRRIADQQYLSMHQAQQKLPSRNSTSDRHEYAALSPAGAKASGAARIGSSSSPNTSRISPSPHEGLHFLHDEKSHSRESMDNAAVRNLGNRDAEIKHMLSRVQEREILLRSISSQIQDRIEVARH